MRFLLLHEAVLRERYSALIVYKPTLNFQLRPSGFD